MYPGSSPAKQKAPERKVVITYPSKIARKVLIKEYESLAKALLYGEPCHIASAVMRSRELRTSVIQKVLELVAKEITGLCSRKNPSLLRKTSKSDLVNFSLQSLCEEWKARAPTQAPRLGWTGSRYAGRIVVFLKLSAFSLVFLTLYGRGYLKFEKETA